MNKLNCDILIFGAGVIGSSLALRVAQSKISVVIVDQKNPISINNNTHPSARVSAINYSSVEFFKKIDVWKNISSNFYTSYHQLETWEWANSVVTFHAESMGLFEMGRIIENHRLQLALWENIKNIEIITLFCPSTLISLKYDGIHWQCILNNNIIVFSRLLIGADGSNSKIRKKLGIKTTTWKYNQSCMLLTIKSKKFKPGTIWQKFTPDGPIGFLPLYDNWGSLMWFAHPKYIQQLKNLTTLDLEKKIENSFQNYLGKIKLYNMSVVALIHQHAHRYIAEGGVLIGDAAHTIHPLAGQGINLGIRDVMVLSDFLIKSNIFDKRTSITESYLKIYQNNRQFDVYFMQFSINLLYVIFNNNFLPVKIARNMSFMTINQLFCIKKRILKYAMGL